MGPLTLFLFMDTNGEDLIGSSNALSEGSHCTMFYNFVYSKNAGSGSVKLVYSLYKVQEKRSIAPATGAK